jgi:hypothetical protein
LLRGSAGVRLSADVTTRQQRHLVPRDDIIILQDRRFPRTW